MTGDAEADVIDRLHPVVVRHIVNTLGWRMLRPLQEQAVAPLLAGRDALLLAPTAGGKTEAAVFPLLTAMEQQGWRGLSVLYVCPLKALLNNLLPRLESYAGWLGRRVALWHGDVAPTQRRRILQDPPDLLLTTPESLEAMLVSQNVDHPTLFAGVRVIVVDEVHAFAGDDRGWHLLAVLERLTRLAGHPIQRVGLSATVGNPEELLTWLQGSGRGRSAEVVAPGSGLDPAGLSTPTGQPSGDVELDYVGSVSNAAVVIAALHGGEKRLVFCDSRQLVEELGAALRSRGVTTFLSHASLSADERHRAEQAFDEARDCVIVATSTLELGIDVGDLDRVIQLNTPPSVPLTQRAHRVLAEIRDAKSSTVHPGGAVITRGGDDVRLWTWAGYRANATLSATLAGLTDEKQRADDASFRLRSDLTREMWRAGTADAADRLCLPDVDDKALAGLKFSEALPRRLAEATLAARLADLHGAHQVLHEPVRFHLLF